MRILVPGYKSKEFWILQLFSGFLVARTVLSVYVAQLDGLIVSALVRGQKKQFIIGTIDVIILMKGILSWMAMAVPATYTNSMLAYLQKKLALAFRTNLTTHLNTLYLENNTFYKVTNLDDRIKNPDQLLTNDTLKFCEKVAELYSSLAKPMLDIVIYNGQLARTVGLDGVVGVGFIIYASSLVLRYFTPAFGTMVANEGKLEGNFRFMHSRLIENSEEIALYSGEAVEKEILNSAYDKLLAQSHSINKSRIWHGMLEDFIIKYFWGAMGLVLCAVPVFVNLGTKMKLKLDMSDVGNRTQSFVTNRRLLLSSSDAFGRVM